MHTWLADVESNQILTKLLQKAQCREGIAIDGDRLRSFVPRSLEIFPSRRVIDHMLGVLRSLTSIFCGDGRLNSDRRRIWNGSGRPTAAKRRRCYDRQNRGGVRWIGDQRSELSIQQAMQVSPIHTEQNQNSIMLPFIRSSSLDDTVRPATIILTT